MKEVQSSRGHESSKRGNKVGVTVVEWVQVSGWLHTLQGGGGAGGGCGSVGALLPV